MSATAMSIAATAPCRELHLFRNHFAASSSLSDLVASDFVLAGCGGPLWQADVYTIQVIGVDCFTTSWICSKDGPSTLFKKTLSQQGRVFVPQGTQKSPPPRPPAHRASATPAFQGWTARSVEVMAYNNWNKHSHHAWSEVWKIHEILQLGRTKDPMLLRDLLLSSLDLLGLLLLLLLLPTKTSIRPRRV